MSLKRKGKTRYLPFCQAKASETKYTRNRRKGEGKTEKGDGESSLPLKLLIQMRKDEDGNKGKIRGGQNKRGWGTRNPSLKHPHFERRKERGALYGDRGKETDKRKLGVQKEIFPRLKFSRKERRQGGQGEQPLERDREKNQ